jgi:soluble lytic murein transglycosylase-like protein
MGHPLLLAALFAGLGLCGSQAARAAERISLANGFDLVCDHHAIVEGRVRVYLKAAQPDYFELSPDAIREVETVPDSPEVEAQVRSESASASQLPAERKVADARLTAADLHQLLSKASAEHNVDEDLLASVVKAESDGHTHAVSRAGARGLMQLMPGTAKQLGVDDSFVPEQNVRGGTAYLDSLLTRYHDNIALALAAYNAGPDAVDRYHGIPPYRETRVYVARVVHEFNRRVNLRKKIAAASYASDYGSR